jgi:hypothetical protein
MRTNLTKVALLASALFAVASPAFAFDPSDYDPTKKNNKTGVRIDLPRIGMPGSRGNTPYTFNDPVAVKLRNPSDATLYFQANGRGYKLEPGYEITFNQSVNISFDTGGGQGDRRYNLGASGDTPSFHFEWTQSGWDVFRDDAGLGLRRR